MSNDAAISANNIHYPWGRGWLWIGEGAQMFLAAPGTWVLLLILQLVVDIGLSILPDAGIFGGLIQLGVGVASVVIGVFFEAGLLLGCQAQRRGETLEVATLFAAFGHPAARGLLGLAFIQICAWAFIALIALVSVVVVIGTGLSLLTMGASAIVNDILGSLTSVMVVFLLVMTLSLLVAMALWMATPLVLFRGFTPVQAMIESFNANFRNVRALTVYGLGMVALAIVAVLPLLLGLLALVPIATTSRYVAFCDLFRGTDSIEKQAT